MTNPEPSQMTDPVDSTSRRNCMDVVSLQRPICQTTMTPGQAQSHAGAAAPVQLGSNPVAETLLVPSVADPVAGNVDLLYPEAEWRSDFENVIQRLGPLIQDIDLAMPDQPDGDLQDTIPQFKDIVRLTAGLKDLDVSYASSQRLHEEVSERLDVDIPPHSERWVRLKGQIKASRDSLIALEEQVSKVNSAIVLSMRFTTNVENYIQVKQVELHLLEHKQKELETKTAERLERVGQREALLLQPSHSLDTNEHDLRRRVTTQNYRELTDLVDTISGHGSQHKQQYEVHIRFYSHTLKKRDAEIAGLRAELQEVHARAINAQVDSSQAQQILQDELKAANFEYQNAKDSITRRDASLKTMTLRCNDHDLSLASLNQKHGEQQGRISGLEGTLKELQLRLDLVKTKRDSLQNELREARSESDRASSLLDEKTRYSESLSLSLDSERLETLALLETQGELKGRISQLQTEMAKREEMFQANTRADAVETLRTAVVALEREFALLRSEKDASQKATEKATSTTEASLTQLNQDNTNLRLDLGIAKTDCANLRAEKASRDVQIEELRQRLDDAAENCIREQGKATLLEKQLETSQAALAKLTRENVTLQLGYDRVNERLRLKETTIARLDKSSHTRADVVQGEMRSPFASSHASLRHPANSRRLSPLESGEGEASTESIGRDEPPPKRVRLQPNSPSIMETTPTPRARTCVQGSQRRNDGAVDTTTGDTASRILSAVQRDDDVALSSGLQTDNSRPGLEEDDGASGTGIGSGGGISRSIPSRTASRLISIDNALHKVEWCIANVRNAHFDPSPVPRVVLDKLRDRMGYWDNCSRTTWTRAARRRNCVEMRAQSKKSQWTHSEDMKCDMCYETKRLCVVVMKGGLMELLPNHERGVASGPTDSNYWL